MKKSILAVLAIVAFSFASCGEPESTNNPGNPGECKIVHEGTTYIGPCDEIQRVIDENSNPSIQ